MFSGMVDWRSCNGANGVNGRPKFAPSWAPPGDKSELSSERLLYIQIHTYTHIYSVSLSPPPLFLSLLRIASSSHSALMRVACAPFSLISRHDRPYARVSISPLRPLLIRSDEEERDPRPILEVILEEENRSPFRLVRRNFHQRLSTQRQCSCSLTDFFTQIYVILYINSKKALILLVFFMYDYLKL